MVLPEEEGRLCVQDGCCNYPGEQVENDRKYI